MSQDKNIQDQGGKAAGSAGHKPQASGQPPAEPVSRAQLFTFWGAVVFALIAARVLDNALPGTPERVIERWIMLAFGVFLAGFLTHL